MLIRTRLANDPLMRLFDSMLAPRTEGAPPSFGAGFPPLNVWEDGERVIFEAELPGVRMEDIEVTATANALRISGSRQATIRDDATVVRHERMTGTFDRAVSLPTAIDAEHVEATLRDGMLTLVLPKAASVRARKIAVQGDNR